MRFYILPTAEGKTTCINFDHVTTITVEGKTISITLVASETPIVVAKTPTTLAFVSKGMDLSDNSKDMVSQL